LAGGRLVSFASSKAGSRLTIVIVICSGRSKKNCAAVALTLAEPAR